MVKFRRKFDLSKKEVEELLLDFSITLSEIKDPREATLFIQDILSEQEAKMLAKRLKVAELLLSNQTYVEITERLKVSMSTIARVNEWLGLSGEGYRLLISRLRARRKNIKPPKRNYGSLDIKRQYPMYYWPELLLESIVAAANRRQKKQIAKALEEMSTKKKLYRRLERILKHHS